MLTTLGIELDDALDPNAKLRKLLERSQATSKASEARAAAAHAHGDCAPQPKG